jgi:hypothetical protein
MSYGNYENIIDNDLDYHFIKHILKSSKGRNEVSLSKISEIDLSIPFIYNSVNVFVGSRSSGKTYTFLISPRKEHFISLRLAN